MGSVECSGDFLEGDGRLGEVKTIGEVVGTSVGVSERGQIEVGLDEFEDAAEVVGDVRNVRGLGVGRDDDEGNAEPVDIAGSPADASPGMARLRPIRSLESGP